MIFKHACRKTARLRKYARVTALNIYFSLGLRFCVFTKENSFQAEVMTSRWKSSASWKIRSLGDIPLRNKDDFAFKTLSHQFHPSRSWLNQTHLSRRRKRESGMINLNAPPWLLIIFRVFSSSSCCGPTKIHIWARGSSSRPDMQPVQWVGGQRELLTSRLRHSASQGQGRKAAFARIFLLFCVCVAGLFSRIVLSSGSALSPWALQTDPFFIKRRVAEHTGCHGDLEEEDIAPCLRNLPLEKLLQTRPGPPRWECHSSYICVI